MSSAMTLKLREPVDLSLTLAPLRHGFGDPTVRIDGAEALRAARTPDGPATLHLHVGRTEVAARAWGPGAACALELVPDLLGLHDDPAALVTDHPVVRALHRRLRGLRLCRSRAIIEVLVPTILEQKIASHDARRSFHALVRRYGEPAPGPGGLMLPPSPQRLASVPYWAFHPLGVARSRAETIRTVCRLAARMEDAATLAPGDAAALLRIVPGVGQWTAAHVTAAALGDPDAVVVGDLHLPRLVAWTLVGERWADDARMLELLAAFPGQRGRVVRLIAAAGLRPPARTNRRRLHRIAGH